MTWLFDDGEEVFNLNYHTKTKWSRLSRGLTDTWYLCQKFGLIDEAHTSLSLSLSLSVKTCSPVKQAEQSSLSWHPSISSSCRSLTFKRCQWGKRAFDNTTQYCTVWVHVCYQLKSIKKSFCFIIMNFVHFRCGNHILFLWHNWFF